MRWSGAGCMPALPDPRSFHSMSLAADGSVALCGGYNMGGLNMSLAADEMSAYAKWRYDGCLGGASGRRCRTFQRGARTQRA